MESGFFLLIDLEDNFFIFGFEETSPLGKRTLWAQVSE